MVLSGHRLRLLMTVSERIVLYLIMVARTLVISTIVIECVLSGLWIDKP